MALSQICQPCVQYKRLSPLNKPGTDILRLFCGNFGAVSTKGAQLERHKMRSEKLQSTTPDFKLYFGVFPIILREARGEKLC